MYKIRCTVSGGVTGYRTAYLKENGHEVEYSTREEAQREADALMASSNSGPRTASFNYSVEEQ